MPSLSHFVLSGLSQQHVVWIHHLLVERPDDPCCVTQLNCLESSLRSQSDAMVVYSCSKLPDGRISVLGIVQERPNACKDADAGLQIICGCSTLIVPLAGQ